MKKYLLTPLLILLSLTIAYAQHLKPNSIVRANRVTFNIKEVTTHGIPSDYMSIVNNNSIYHGRIPKNRNPDMSFPFTDKSKLLSAFIQTFSFERIKQLLPERRMIITFYVSPQGKVLDVSFLVNKNTLLTAAELENLETAIKANVSFKIKLEDGKEHDFFDVGYPVIYERILKGTI
ncbi:MAG: hypothetical protein ACHQF4_09780 [Sphingobacteriales bacterium]